jgi:ribosomal protein L23
MYICNVKDYIDERAFVYLELSNFEKDYQTIKKAIEEMYSVHVTDVRTQMYGGGVSSSKYTNKGIVEQKSKQWKKAVVTIADGETIDLFNNY